MIRRKDIRKGIAWMLIITFMQFFVVKSLHYHTDDECNKTSHSQEKHHSCDNCPICHFSLSSFTEAENIEIQFFTEFLSIQQTFINDIETIRPLYHPYLRAPPFA